MEAEKSLNDLSEIEFRYIAPKSNKYEHRQRFYRLKNASQYNFIDFALFQDQWFDEFLHPVRHGKGCVLFDRTNSIEFKEVDQISLVKEFSKRLRDIDIKFYMFGRPIVEKSIMRSHLSDAVYHYNQRVLLPIIEFARALHSPLRQDFGQRYLAYDLPKSLRTKIDELHIIQSLAHLSSQLNRAEMLFEELKSLYDATEEYKHNQNRQ